jgi:hypothetical protein
MTSETITLDRVLDISEQLSASDQLRLISLMSERLRSRMGQEGERVDMLSLVGLGAELWRKLNTDAYLEQERASWDG